MLNLKGLDSLNLDTNVPSQASGSPLVVVLSEVYEDPANPRTEFDPTELQELADDIVQHGILQPIVVWPLDRKGYKIRYGAKRRRAAEIAAAVTGVNTVTVIIDSADVDDYAQVSENLKRSGLTPMDMARFIERKVAQGDSQTTIAKRLGLSKGRITEFLELLDLPTPLRLVYEDGHCMNPQVLYLLASVYRRFPESVVSWLASLPDITRATVTALDRHLLQHGVPPEEQPQEKRPEGGVVPPVERFASGLKVASKHGAARHVHADVAALERRITESLGARSAVQYNQNTGAGTLRIRFTCLDELDGLLERFRIPKE